MLVMLQPAARLAIARRIRSQTLIGHMIVQNVLHRPVRTVITVFAVAVEVMLVIIVVGLTTGLMTDPPNAPRA